jgi:hypothetical protein
LCGCQYAVSSAGRAAKRSSETMYVDVEAREGLPILEQFGSGLEHTEPRARALTGRT